jgi:hypothetical protein
MANINWDDDEAVERYKDRQAMRVEAAEKKAELKRNAHSTDDKLLAEVIRKAEQVVSNIEHGYSVCELETLHIYFNKPFELGQKDSVVIIASREGFSETPEVRVLQQLCQEGEYSCSPSELMSKLMRSGQYKDLGVAAPALVDAGVKAGIVKAADADRLKKLYSVWLKGVSWSKCELSATNRPSLASWNGFPWDVDEMVGKHLSSGIVGKNAGIYTNFALIETTADEDVLPLFKLLWKRGSGRSNDIAQLVRDAYSERKADELAHPPARKGAAEPKAKKAKTKK